MGDRRFKPGEIVIWRKDVGVEEQVQVMGHGRDSDGVYTEIETPVFRERVKVHRSTLRPLPPLRYKS